MSRTASWLGLPRENGKISIIEINSETDFVAKNKDFIIFEIIRDKFCYARRFRES